MTSYKFADIQARPFPNFLEIMNPNIYGRADIVINVSSKEYSEEIERYLKQHNKHLYYYPLIETGNDMGLENILRCVSILEQADKNKIPVIIHCDCGNNRSRVVIECFHYRKLGYQYIDEYKGAINHLAYNCSIGLLPPIEEVEKTLRKLPRTNN